MKIYKQEKNVDKIVKYIFNKYVGNKEETIQNYFSNNNNNELLI